MAYGKIKPEIKASLQQAKFGLSLKARAHVLLTSAEASVHSVGLEHVWPDSRSLPALKGSSDREEALWQQCLINFGASIPALARAADHFLKIIDVGFDANRVRFPHQAFRQGFPAPLPPLTPHSCLTAIDRNSLPFPLLKDLEDGSGAAWLKGVEEEVGQKWLAGLAQNSLDLRAEVHDNSATFDMILTEWPMMDADVIEEECCSDGASTFFEEQRFLREEMHQDDGQMYVSMEDWPMLPINVVKDDLCTEMQLEVVKLRAKRGPLSELQLQARREDLHKKFVGRAGESKAKLAMFNRCFFEPISPMLEKDAALAEMRARRAADEARRARAYDEAAEFGAQFVQWPVSGEGRWPRPSAAWTEHSQKFRERRQSKQTKAWTSTQLCHKAHAGDDAVRETWLRWMSRLSSIDEQIEQSMSSGSCSEPDWEALSECSDLSQQLDDVNWLDLASQQSDQDVIIIGWE